jgi:hypothetical protein
MKIPASPDEPTAGWLTSVLSAQGLGANGVLSCDTEMLRGERGMTGQLARLRIRYQDDRPGLPATLIAKFSAAEPAERALISALGHYDREVRFYELLSSRTPVPTPALLLQSPRLRNGFCPLGARGSCPRSQRQQHRGMFS